jgi:hypothetical protein
MTNAPKAPDPKPEKKSEMRNIDRDAEDSLPASDPPSYYGMIIGAPKRPHKDSN